MFFERLVWELSCGSCDMIREWIGVEWMGIVRLIKSFKLCDIDNKFYEIGEIGEIFIGESS